MNLKAYLHHKGSNQAPNHSEYEISMSGTNSIEVTTNAKIIDNFLQVIDETKPVFIIITSIYDFNIWKLDFHLQKNNESKSIEAKPVLNSEAGAMINNKLKPDYLKSKNGHEGHAEGFISIRRDQEIYHACAKKNDLNLEKIQLISFQDLLAFISGDIEWKNLKGRSFLQVRKVRKEISSQLKNAELAEELLLLKENLSKIPKILLKLFSINLE